VAGHIEFDAVAFRYPGALIDAVQNVSFAVKPGQTVAVVGRSGSGKSTLLKLLARFYTPSAGQISLDGQDIQAVNLQNFREQFAFVPQKINLFSDTVAGNIAMGSSVSKTLEDIEGAAQKAHADPFIQELRSGYDTLIGEQGVGLSGGQQQRIAIARALLKSAPVLILDEATSALDNESEALIQLALESSRQGRTTFVVAHRLSTIEGADTVLVMDEGQIVAQGTHSELLTQEPLYRALHQHGFSEV
jgi:subfamily B ATP-binding cassette protein MsbA